MNIWKWQYRLILGLIGGLVFGSVMLPPPTMAQDGLSTEEIAALENVLTGITLINNAPSFRLNYESTSTNEQDLQFNGVSISTTVQNESQTVNLQFIRSVDDANIGGTLEYARDSIITTANTATSTRENVRILAEARRVEGTVYVLATTVGVGQITPETWIRLQSESEVAPIFTDYLDVSLFFNINGDANDLRQQSDLIRDAAQSVQTIDETLDDGTPIKTTFIVLDPIKVWEARGSTDLISLLIYQNAQVWLFYVEQAGIPLEIALSIEATVSGVDLNAFDPEYFPAGLSLATANYSEQTTYRFSEVFTPFAPALVPSNE